MSEEIGYVKVDTWNQISLLTLPVCTSVHLSIHPSVCPIDRWQQPPPSGLLLSAPQTENIDRQQASVAYYFVLKLIFSFSFYFIV